jgi:ribosomal protein S18 acetylase RimI-like enzyme
MTKAAWQTPFTFRKARLKDIPRLQVIENACFDGDRLSRRSFQWLIKNGHSELVCVEFKGTVAGYGLLFYRRGTTLARLYSFAVHPDFQGKGIARELLNKLEAMAREAKKSALRLEVRADNEPAIRLYESLNYKRFKVKLDYYEDHSQALCYEKRLTQPSAFFKLKVPFYAQTTDFTCGPASLLMGMKALDKSIELSQHHELDLWREATTIFMLSGHGGCGPRGLALAAHKRGFNVEIFLSHKKELFSDSVRSVKKKEILKVVHDGFKAKIKASKIPISYRPVTLSLIKERLKAGQIPIILISAYQITQLKTPHWVVISGMDENFIYLHDPDVDDEQNELQTNYDGVYLPISHGKFKEMAKWGSKKMAAALFVSRSRPKGRSKQV